MLNILQVYFEEKNKYCSCLPFENLSLETVFVVRDIHIYSNSLMLLKNTRINSAISKIEEVVVLEPQFKGNKTV